MSVRIDPIVPSEEDVHLAREVRLALQGDGTPEAALKVQVDGAAKPIDLPPLVGRLLLDILEQTAAGHAVSLVPVEAEITTYQAAALLNVSRPYLIGLVEKGVLPARLVGAHRRLPLREVLAYKREEFAQRSEGLDELVAHGQALGLYE